MSLTYGIDIHGTLSCRRKDKSLAPSTLLPLLRPLMAALVAQGEKVYIVSGPPRQVIEQEIADLGLVGNVHYHHIVSMVDFLKSRGIPMREDPAGSNHWWCDDPTWNAAKGWMADALDIDILIDDQAEYKRAMPPKTTFVHVKAHLLEKCNDG